MEKVQFINRYTKTVHDFVNDTVKPNLGIYLESTDIDRLTKSIIELVKSEWQDVTVIESKIRYYIVSIILKEFGTLAFGVELGKDLRK